MCLSAVASFITRIGVTHICDTYAIRSSIQMRIDVSNISRACALYNPSSLPSRIAPIDTTSVWLHSLYIYIYIYIYRFSITNLTQHRCRASVTRMPCSLVFAIITPNTVKCHTSVTPVRVLHTVYAPSMCHTSRTLNRTYISSSSSLIKPLGVRRQWHIGVFYNIHTAKTCHTSAALKRTHIASSSIEHADAARLYQ